MPRAARPARPSRRPGFAPWPYAATTDAGAGLASRAGRAIAEPSEIPRAAESAGKIAETGLVPVAKRRTHQSGRSRPRPAAQHAMAVEPWPRIAFVRIGAEARIGREPARRPFPHAGGRLPRGLELELGGQPRTAPGRAGLGFEPRDAGDGRIRRLLVEAGRRAHRILPHPLPPVARPVLWRIVAACRDELAE